MASWQMRTWVLVFRLLRCIGDEGPTETHAIPGKARTAGGSGAPRSSLRLPSPSESTHGPIKAGPNGANKPATDQSTMHKRPMLRALLWQGRAASDREVVMVATA